MTDISGKTAGLWEALEYLNKFQFHGFRLGLERMEAILNALDSPEKDYLSIHVAGTNGKGSTCAIINSILTCAGYRTGFYSSPHLYRLNERFKTGSMEISDAELVSILTRIREFIEDGYEMSYFEYTTAAAMLWFRDREIDIAIFETGLGGRLDATNVIDPAVTVITNIALEHQSFLGDTMEKIAFEKAGIIKPGCPVICSVPPGPALSVIEKRCGDRNAPLRLYEKDFSFTVSSGKMTWHGWNGEHIMDIVPAFRGEHQAVNTAVAIAAVKGLPPERFQASHRDIRKGCTVATWPGRSEILAFRESTILLDGAHNMHGVNALMRMMDDKKTNHGREQWDVLLWACSDEGGDKKFREMLKPLAQRFKKVIITEPPGPRKPVTVEAWRQCGIAENCMLEKEWHRALEMTLESSPRHGLICVAGSLYLVGSVREQIVSMQSISFT